MARGSNSSPTQASGASHFKCIIAIGVVGSEEDVARFAALWIMDSEKRAHSINNVVFKDRLTLLPLPEEAPGELQE
jgi:hypothetical protein